MKNSDYQIWTRLLDEAPQGSALMGGAIVDSIVGVKPKDYDIFHPYKVGMPDVPSNWAYIKPVDLEAHQEQYDIPTKNGMAKPIGSVYSYDVIVPGQVVRVQLIGVHLPDVKQHLKDFDHSLTLGLYNKSGLFVHSKVYESIDTMTVTLINKTRPEKSRIRAEKKIMKLDPNGFDLWNYKGW